MKKIYYLFCPACKKEYYMDRELYIEQKKNPKTKLLCPYCHHEFYGKDARFVEE